MCASRKDSNVNTTVIAHGHNGMPRDPIMYTSGSLNKARPGMGNHGQTRQEDSGTYEIIISSMIRIAAADNQHHKARRVFTL